MSKFRKLLLKPAFYASRLLLIWCGFYWVTEKGKKASKKEAPVIVANVITIL